MGNNIKQQKLNTRPSTNTNSLSAVHSNFEGALLERLPDKNEEARKRVAELFEAVYEEILSILTKLDASKPIPGPDGTEEEYDHDGYAYKLRRSVVRQSREEMMSLLKRLNEEFPAELTAREPWRVPKYVSENKKIRDRLQQTRFLDVLDWLYRHRLTGNAETRKIIASAGGDFWKGGFPSFKGETEDVIVTPDIEQMALELQLSTHSIRKYLQKFVEIEILLPFKKRYGRGDRKSVV